MRTGIDCFACFMQQALTTVKQCTEDTDLQVNVLSSVGEALRNVDLEKSPPENLASLYPLMAEITKNPDPYAAIKKQENDHILRCEPTIRATIEEAADPLLAAIRFAIAGNVLDSGSQQQIDIETALANCQKQHIAVNHYAHLQKQLSKSKRILYLTDNCGEIVFDKLVISQLVSMGLDVTAAVRKIPVINDATMEDAVYCGLDTICPVITNGTGIPGTVLSHCSAEFRDAFYGADCIISKGMGNFESLSETDAPIVFLLTVKCSTVLDYLKDRYTPAQPHIGSPVIVAPNF